MITRNNPIPDSPKVRARFEEALTRLKQYVAAVAPRPGWNACQVEVPLTDFVWSSTGEVPAAIQKGLEVAKLGGEPDFEPVTSVTFILSYRPDNENHGYWSEHEYRLNLSPGYGTVRELATLRHELGHVSQTIGTALIQAGIRGEWLRRRNWGKGASYGNAPRRVRQKVKGKQKFVGPYAPGWGGKREYEGSKTYTVTEWEMLDPALQTRLLAERTANKDWGGVSHKDRDIEFHTNAISAAERYLTSKSSVPTSETCRRYCSEARPWEVPKDPKKAELFRKQVFKLLLKRFNLPPEPYMPMDQPKRTRPSRQKSVSPVQKQVAPPPPPPTPPPVAVDRSARYASYTGAVDVRQDGRWFRVYADGKDTGKYFASREKAEEKARAMA